VIGEDWSSSPAIAPITLPRVNEDRVSFLKILRWLQLSLPHPQCVQVLQKTAMIRDTEIPSCIAAGQGKKLHVPNHKERIRQNLDSSQDIGPPR